MKRIVSIFSLLILVHMLNGDLLSFPEANTYSIRGVKESGLLGGAAIGSPIYAEICYNGKQNPFCGWDSKRIAVIPMDKILYIEIK